MAIPAENPKPLPPTFSKHDVDVNERAACVGLAHLTVALDDASKMAISKEAMTAAIKTLAYMWEAHPEGSWNDPLTVAVFERMKAHVDKVRSEQD